MALPSSAPVPVASVAARVQAIREHWSPAASLDVTVSFEPPADPAGFDAFGPTYQAALEAAERGATAATGAADVLDVGSLFPTAAPTSWSVTTAGSSVGRIGGFGAMPVPAALTTYGNGRVPTDALVPIGQGGHRLYGPAAAAWRSLVEAAAADGITMRVTDSYRSFDEQVDLAARKGLYKDGGYAAVPGTSNHGWGLAVDADVTDPAALSWLRANGARFGFVEAVPREPWHWEYRPAQA